jgi:hypothetical protein
VLLQTGSIGLNWRVRLVVSHAAAELIQQEGGRLYVWPKKAACCGGLMTLATSTTPPPRHFRRVAESDGLELLFPDALTRMPDELHLDLGRFSGRVEAYWNGCAWVT